MNSEQWRQVRGVFAEAVGRSGGSRAAFIAEACGGDRQLIAEVESLLAHDSRAEGFLDADPSWRPISEVHADSSDVNLQLGAYRLVRQIGSGGMGAIWLAERTDEHFQGRAAVKLIKRGMDTDDLLIRFRRERQVLANLRHPNICRLLDGGAAPDGRPYLVMDYVEGEPITRYCDRRGLSIPQRLELFRLVCDAVQFAHQNLVVHRDLKPGNILVSHDGVPILLDFGIAKVLQPDDPSVVQERTIAEQRLLTPHYASPEHIRGETITTSTDVFSLGVVLYELLTGQRPFCKTTGTRLDVERAICEETPERPSTAILRPSKQASRNTIANDPSQFIDVRRWRRMLRGDLDTIVMKALQKEPTRRYASAAQFSEDIRRHLHGEPVAARPDTFVYRVRKFVRRNRAAVGLLAVIVLALIGWAASATRHSVQLTRQRNKAQAAEQLAAATEEFLREMLRSVEPKVARGRDTTLLRELVDGASARIDAEFNDQPILAARLHLLLGEVYQSLRLHHRAESHFRTATGSLEAHPDQPLAMINALHKTAETLEARGRPGVGEPLVRRALSIAQASFGAKGVETLTAMNRLGGVYTQQSRFSEAEAMFQEALALTPQDEGHCDVRAPIHNNWANALLAKGDFAGALPLYRQAYREWMSSGDRHRELIGICLSNMANCLTHQGQLEEAERILKESLQILQDTRGESEQIWTRNLLGSLCLRRGDYASAARIFREALDLHKQRTDWPLSMDRVNVQHNLGIILFAHGDHEAAEPLLRDAWRLSEELLGKNHPTSAVVGRNLAMALQALGRLPEAEGMLLDAVQLHLAAIGKDDPANASITLTALGSFYADGTHDPDAAAELYGQAIALALAQKLHEWTDLAGPMNGLAEILIQRGDVSAAARLVQNAYDLQCRVLPIDHPDCVPTLLNQASLALHDSDWADAEKCLRSAQHICERSFLPNHPLASRTRERLSKLLNDSTVESGPHTRVLH